VATTQKRNYDLEMERELSRVTGTPSLLLHCCCAPCATTALERLVPRLSVTALYYNPNIMPTTEYELRLGALQKLLGRYPNVPLLADEYDDAPFLTVARGLERETEGGARCALCFELRLRETARRARDGGFDCFATTLTTGPRKNAEVINAIGEKLAAEYNVRYLPTDLKKRGGYQRSVALSSEFGLYRQRYCGCDVN
jgi:predicted adenine nucleotide alpha hydrolase (AANH) superfamily ATPase